MMANITKRETIRVSLDGTKLTVLTETQPVFLA